MPKSMGEWKLARIRVRILLGYGQDVVNLRVARSGHPWKAIPPQQRNPETGCINMC